MKFDDLGLSAELLRAVAEQGYTVPTPVQVQAIPAVLADRDLMAGAQTGTGKTAAFTLPLLQNLMRATHGGRRRVRALVLTPTRELAAQVGESVRTYGKHLPLRSAEIFGGVNINPQIKALRNGVDILVATPGRLLDHVEQRTADLSAVEILVLDEADRMLDMGFLPAIERVLKALPSARQTLLFSATFPDPIRKLARRLQVDPVVVEVARANAPADAVSHNAYFVDQGRKRELLSYLIGSQNWQQVLVFTRTKHGANRLSEQLCRDGIAADAIHGNKSQGARTRALEGFKRQKVRVLVATDIAARGLDIDELPHVVNYELPHVAEDYVHRIGRTGRAGREGAALSLVCADERGALEAIKRLMKVEITTATVPGYEPTQSASANPTRRPGGGAGKPAHARRDHSRRDQPQVRSHGPRPTRGGSGRKRVAR
ncbi:MAG: DEAD/DEAH box helicase [Gammaproteobacteria bacterium]|nr:DEAD/DEAH box helicase [Gammaproteobacteria bacterium]